jgi:hypothetical protein
MPPPLRKTLMLIAVFFIKISLMVEPRPSGRQVWGFIQGNAWACALCTLRRGKSSESLIKIIRILPENI